MSSGVEFMNVFGTRCAVLPVTEENVIRAASVIWNRRPPNAPPLQIGSIAKVYAVDRKTLEKAETADHATATAYAYLVKFGDFERGIKEVHISRHPKGLSWEDAKKLVILIPEPQ